MLQKIADFYNSYYPIIIVGAVIGAITTAFIIAYATMKDKKNAIGFDRHIKDSEIIKRLLKYAKPYVMNFVAVGFIMLFSISYDIVSPLIMGNITDLLQTDFKMRDILWRVALYATILIVSLLCTYVQSIILQKTGQRILSNLRQDLFSHIESLSHEQLHQIPVGTLVTRVTNDTNAISMLFTNIIVNLAKNIFMVFGILVAMLCVNYALTVMILCFVPFVAIFTIIFRKFSRRAYRKVKDGTTDINIFLSENLSGMKITQIFNREERKGKEFSEKNIRLGKAKQREIFVFAIFRPCVYMLYVSSIMCLFFLSAKCAIGQTSMMGQIIDAGVLVSFYIYINKFFNPIQTLAEQFNRLQSALASAEKIFTIFNMKPVVVDEPDAIELENVKGDIEFKKVWF